MLIPSNPINHSVSSLQFTPFSQPNLILYPSTIYQTNQANTDKQTTGTFVTDPSLTDGGARPSDNPLLNDNASS